MNTRIAINGANGRMGRSMTQLAPQWDIELTHLYVRPATPDIAQPAEANPDLLFESSELLGQHASQQEFEVLIDFSPPDSVLHSLDVCIASQCPLVTGTTGFDDAKRAKIEQASEHIPVVFAPNMSIGINLCFQLLKQVAATIGNESDIEIIEAHHRHKKDAPSGTSLHIGNIIAKQLGISLSESAVYGRYGSSQKRKGKEIGFQVIRAGDIVGEHTAMFVMNGESVEITHKAFSRESFARGALRAAIWLKAQPAGLYTMRDVLGLK